MADYEKKFPAQKDYGWGLTFKTTDKAPAIAKRIFNTYSDALAYAQNEADSCIEGLQLSVVNDGDNNGVYFVKAIGRNAALDKLGNGGGGQQVQSDWNETDSSKVDFIKNKPDVFTKQETTNLVNGIVVDSVTEKPHDKAPSVSSIMDELDSRIMDDSVDWTKTDKTISARLFQESARELAAHILDEAANYTDTAGFAKSSELATVATSGDYFDLNNRPNIPAEQVQSDWDEDNTSVKSYIRNKPTFKTINGESILGNGDIEIGSESGSVLDNYVNAEPIFTKEYTITSASYRRLFTFTNSDEDLRVQTGFCEGRITITNDGGTINGKYSFLVRLNGQIQGWLQCQDLGTTTSTRGLYQMIMRTPNAANNGSDWMVDIVCNSANTTTNKRNVTLEIISKSDNCTIIGTDNDVTYANTSPVTLQNNGNNLFYMSAAGALQINANTANSALQLSNRLTKYLNCTSNVTGQALASGDLIFASATDNKLYNIANTTQPIDCDGGIIEITAAQAANANATYNYMATICGNSCNLAGMGTTYPSTWTTGTPLYLKCTYPDSNGDIYSLNEIVLDKSVGGYTYYLLGRQTATAQRIALNTENSQFESIDTDGKLTFINGVEIKTGDLKYMVDGDGDGSITSRCDALPTCEATQPSAISLGRGQSVRMRGGVAIGGTSTTIRFTSTDTANQYYMQLYNGTPSWSNTLNNNETQHYYDGYGYSGWIGARLWNNTSYKYVGKIATATIDTNNPYRMLVTVDTTGAEDTIPSGNLQKVMAESSHIRTANGTGAPSVILGSVNQIPAQNSFILGNVNRVTSERNLIFGFGNTGVGFGNILIGESNFATNINNNANQATENFIFGALNRISCTGNNILGMANVITNPYNSTISTVNAITIAGNTNTTARKGVIIGNNNTVTINNSNTSAYLFGSNINLANTNSYDTTVIGGYNNTINSNNVFTLATGINSSNPNNSIEISYNNGWTTKLNDSVKYKDLTKVEGATANSISSSAGIGNYNYSLDGINYKLDRVGNLYSLTKGQIVKMSYPANMYVTGLALINYQGNELVTSQTGNDFYYKVTQNVSNVTPAIVVSDTGISLTDNLTFEVYDTIESLNVRLQNLENLLTQ